MDFKYYNYNDNNKRKDFYALKNIVSNGKSVQDFNVFYNIKKKSSNFLINILRIYY